MSVYLKRVDAIQFVITDAQKDLIKSRKAVYFEGSPVKHAGGSQYIALLQQGENLIKIQETQWLVREPGGLWQVYWPDQFGSLFIKGDQPDSINPTATNPFNKAKALKQPNK